MIREVLVFTTLMILTAGCSSTGEFVARAPSVPM